MTSSRLGSHGRRPTGFLARLCGLLAACLALAPLSARAETYRVVLVPLSAMGSEARATTVEGVSADIARAIRSIRNMRVVPRRQLEGALSRARRLELSGCDGAPRCLAEVGQLVSADYAVFGEVGGLGDAQVLYLKLVAVKPARTIRSTTLEFGGRRPGKAAVERAVIQLLAPNLYTGTLDLRVDIDGASIYVDGDKVGESPTASIPLPVGSHALRVTHPEFRDFVRFIDVPFRRRVQVSANLQQFPVVASSIRQHDTGPIPLVDAAPRDDGPWYREWYAVAGIGVGAFVATLVVTSLVTGGIDADASENVDVPEL